MPLAVWQKHVVQIFTAVAIFDSGSSVGGALAALCIPWIALQFGWRSAFGFSGILGLAWLAWVVVVLAGVDLAVGPLLTFVIARSSKPRRDLTRDVAMIVPEKISHAEILRTIQEPKEPLLESVELFDLFTTGLGEARKSLAYRLTYRDRSRTLTNEEVSAAHAKIRERLQRDLSAELRE